MQAIDDLRITESYPKEFVAGVVGVQLGAAIEKSINGKTSAISAQFTSPFAIIGGGLGFILVHALANMVYGDSVWVPFLGTVITGYYNSSLGMY